MKTEEIINHEGPRGTTKRMGAWGRIRGCAGTVAAWGLVTASVLLFIVTVAAWVDFDSILEARVAWRCGDGRTVRTIEVDSWSGILLVGSVRSGFQDLQPGELMPQGVTIQRFTGHARLWSWGRSSLQLAAKAGHCRGSFVMAAASHFRYYPSSDEDVYAVVMPHWALLPLFLILPVLVGWQAWRRGRRVKKGLCLNCGYDLRASPERCPECGMARAGNDEIRNSNDERMSKHE